MDGIDIIPSQAVFIMGLMCIVSHGKLVVALLCQFKQSMILGSQIDSSILPLVNTVDTMIKLRVTIAQELGQEFVKQFNEKSDKITTYTKSEVDALLQNSGGGTSSGPQIITDVEPTNPTIGQIWNKKIDEYQLSVANFENFEIPFAYIGGMASVESPTSNNSDYKWNKKVLRITNSKTYTNSYNLFINTNAERFVGFGFKIKMFSKTDKLANGIISCKVESSKSTPQHNSSYNNVFDNVFLTHSTRYKTLGSSILSPNNNEVNNGLNLAVPNKKYICVNISIPPDCYVDITDFSFNSQTKTSIQQLIYDELDGWVDYSYHKSLIDELELQKADRSEIATFSQIQESILSLTGNLDFCKKMTTTLNSSYSNIDSMYNEFYGYQLEENGYFYHLTKNSSYNGSGIYNLYVNYARTGTNGTTVSATFYNYDQDNDVTVNFVKDQSNYNVVFADGATSFTLKPNQVLFVTGVYRSEKRRGGKECED